MWYNIYGENMSIKKSIYIIILLFSFYFLVAQNSKLIRDYVFLLDTSTSMIGEPSGFGYVDIFEEVKESINNYIFNQIEPPANIFIYNFDEGVRNYEEIHIDCENDKLSAQAIINQLEATGRRTYIYRSLQHVVNRMEQFVEEHPEERHLVTIQLFTDGNDGDSDPNYTMQSSMDYFNEINRNQDWWIIYTTLGMKLVEEDKIILEQTKNVKLIELGKEEPPEILVIEPRITTINFGNLWNNNISKQFGLFKIPPKEKFSDKFNIAVNEDYFDFPAGVGLTIEPENFGLQEKTEFTLEIIGFTQENLNCHGLYNFRINLKPNDQFVLIIPAYIEGTFQYEPPKTVEIMPIKDDKFPLKFGKIEIYKKSEFEKEKKIILKFNNQAKSKGGQIKISWEETKVPTHLNSNNFSINNMCRESIDITPKISNITIKVITNKNMKPGKYQGKLFFTSENISIEDINLKTSKNRPNEKYVNWSFEVPRKPLPIYFWIILIILIFIIMYFTYKVLTKPPVFKDLNMQVIKPYPENISLLKKNAVTFGDKGDYLTQINTNFLIRAEKIGNRMYAVLEVFQGTIKLIKSGDNIETIIYSEERIYDGDIIIFEDYKIEFSSYSLIRE